MAVIRPKKIMYPETAAPKKAKISQGSLCCVFIFVYSHNKQPGKQLESYQSTPVSTCIRAAAGTSSVIKGHSSISLK
jgi:hypothetical protein